LKNYEALFILKPDLEKEGVSELYQKIANTVKKYNGGIQTQEEWGKKTLAYKIKRFKEGTYYLLRFNIDPSQIVYLNGDFKVNEAIIRVLITEV
jgi:small subunit ribosomal protein S6